MLRRIILSAAVAGLLASPAFAQSFSHDFGSGNVSVSTHGGTAMTSGAAYAWHRGR